jgi:hypothetical protein
MERGRWLTSTSSGRAERLTMVLPSILSSLAFTLSTVVEVKFCGRCDAGNKKREGVVGLDVFSVGRK